MATKHTPGPWVANGNIVKANDCYGPWVADTDVMLRHKPNKQHVSHAEQRENAKLIAAAPDLLDVAESAVEFIEAALFGSVHDENARHYAGRLRDAIAKAKGEEA
jgi:hypothetical protein